MYSVDYDCGLIIHVLIVSLVLYCLQLFVVWTNQCIFNNDMTYIIYLLPLFSTFICLLFFFGTSKIDCIFQYICLIIGLYLGYLLYAFQIAIIVRIYIIFIDINYLVNAGILYITPLIICLYGIINAKITKLERINLKFPGYKDKITILHLSDIHLVELIKKNQLKESLPNQKN